MLLEEHGMLQRVQEMRQEEQAMLQDK